MTNKEERYQWIRRTLVKFSYISCGKNGKGLIMRYLEQVSGYSPRQVKRLVQEYRKTGDIKRQQRTASGFERFYRSEYAVPLANPSSWAVLIISITYNMLINLSYFSWHYKFLLVNNRFTCVPVLQQLRF